ncbi:MAG: hypothetical protein LBE76_00510 [Nitrososphaerota archaeon]|nr:hypothetical protein [Nitrososphaerota archaeon]
MNTNVEFRISRKSLLLTSLLVVVLVSSLFVCVFVMNGFSGASLENAVHVKNEAELKNAINNAPDGKPITIALDNDITLTSYEEQSYTYNYQVAALIIPADKDITLTSNRSNGFYKLIGAVETENHMDTILVGGGGILRLDGIIVTHKNGFLGRGVHIQSIGSDGVLYLYSGEISGNTVKSPFSGGGVSNVGTFIMSGGKISGNTAGHSDGGVYTGGTFVMTGGEISGNTAGSCGGGVGTGYYGSFTMSGGIISDNTAMYGGGGVYLDIFSDCVLFGGEIFGNKAFDRGGGVFNSGASSFIVSGGTIFDNSAEEGGGVYHGGEFFTMSGGRITGNSAILGGGVYVHNNFEFNGQGGVISDNTATDKGNNIYPNDDGGGSSNGGGLRSGGNGGTSNGNGEGTFVGDGFSLRDISLICVGVVVGVVVVVLFFAFKKEVKGAKEKIM